MRTSLITTALLLSLTACAPSDVASDKGGTEADDTASDPLTADSDGDGFTEDEGDCDDSNAQIHPNAEEVCDTVDNDCDGLIDVDDEDVVDATTWYTDADGDFYGDPATAVVACEQPAGTLSDGNDCDDSLDSVNPGAPEICNEIDDDCDPATSEDGLASVNGLVGATTLQAAVNQASDGDEIWVCAGTFAGQVFVDSKSISIIGLHGAEATILDRDGSESSVVETGEGTDLTLRGLTITGGEGDIIAEGMRGGGGVNARLASRLVLDGVTVMGNSADVGGGVLGPQTGDLSIGDSTLSGNEAFFGGGGLYAFGGTLVNSLVDGNQSANLGGGIAVEGGDMDLTGTTTISHNTAGDMGGGVALNEAVLTGGTVEANEATGGGAGIVAFGASGLQDLLVRDHYANQGAVYLAGGSYTIQRVQVIENTGSQYVGIYMSRAVASMTSVEVSNNVASFSGGGIAMESSELDMTDSIIILNVARSGSGIYMTDSALALSSVDLGEGSTDNADHDIANQGTSGSIQEYAWSGMVKAVRCDASGKCSSLTTTPF